MTRSRKQNDKDHAGLADGTAAPEQHLPRYFAKAGHAGGDPYKTKKNGGGKANWGEPGEELTDTSFNLTHARRRSNSSTLSAGLYAKESFRTKFDFNEPEPVFEEHFSHDDPVGEGLEVNVNKIGDDAEEGGLHKTETASSDSSVESEDVVRKE